MRKDQDFSSLEKQLRAEAWSDWQGDPRWVWNRYVEIKEGKEEYMAKSSGKWMVSVGVLALLVVAGIFGMGWFFQYQKNQKINQGEAILVTMTIGEVGIRKMGSDTWREVSVDDVIEMGDTLRTGMESACELQIVERGVYRLEANTEILVAKLVNEGGTHQATIHLDKGTVGAKPKKLKEGEVFEVETSTAVAAVRGTVFMVGVTEDGDTKVAVAEGKVSLTPKVASLEEAKQKAKIDAKAYEALQEVVASPVEIQANEEVTLRKEVVETVNQKVAEVIESTVSAKGPLTAENVESLKPAVVAEVKKSLPGQSQTQGDVSSPVPVMVEKKTLTEEAKKILENVQQREPVGKKRVRVSFSADVPGTVVRLNGSRGGKLPLSLILNNDTTYNVVFEKEGYEVLTQEVRVMMPTNIVVTLTPRMKEGVATNRSEQALAPVTNQEETPTWKPGDMVWEKPFSESVSPTMVVVDRGGPTEDRIVCGVDNRIMILNLEGEVIKSFVLGKGTTYDFPVVATAKGIFARDDEGVVYGYDYQGNQKWSVKFSKSPAWTGLGVAKHVLLMPVVQNRIYVLNMANGETVMTIEGGAQIYATPVMVDEKLLVYAQENGVVVGYDTENRAELWRKELGKRFVLPLYGFSEGEKKVAVLPLQGKLIGMHALSGDILWEKDMPGATFATKPFAIGKFLCVVNKNRFEVIDMVTGDVRSRITMNGEILSAQVQKRTVYLLDASGQMKACNLEGETLWSYNAGSGAQGLAIHPEGVYVFRKNSVVKLFNEAPAKR
ncbi:MAG: FecR domain-containing protein [Brevinematales bacterium]|nr:FecR domain-containing protein [Brevinematales bacterium]